MAVSGAAETRSQWLPRNCSYNGSSTPVPKDGTHLTWAPPGLIGLFLFLLATYTKFKVPFLSNDCRSLTTIPVFSYFIVYQSFISKSALSFVLFLSRQVLSQSIARWCLA